MKTVNIKGKDYVEVSERVKYFRTNDDYKGWGIETELLSNEDGVCVIKALIKDENGNIKSSGHAYEKESSSYINKTSYIENCETSAIGRALGMLGIGIDASIASADEVLNAIKNQEDQKEESEKPSPKSLDFTELWEKYKSMSKEELRVEYAQIVKDSELTGNQKKAVCEIINRCQKGKE